jgi:hypothetical protein
MCAHAPRAAVLFVVGGSALWEKLMTDDSCHIAHSGGRHVGNLNVLLRVRLGFKKSFCHMFLAACLATNSRNARQRSSLMKVKAVTYLLPRR